MVKIKDKNRAFNHPDEMVSYLLSFLAITIIENQDGEMKLEKLSKYAGSNLSLVVDFNPEDDYVILTSNIDPTKSNGNMNKGM